MAGDVVPESGASRWLAIHDDLLRGLAHAVSNRMATVTATATLLEHGIMPEPRVSAGLASDAGRLEGLLQALRALPRRVDPVAEPMLVTDAVAGACRLVEEHADLYGRTVAVDAAEDLVPVRAEPGAVLHACAVALLTGARYTAPGGVVRVTLRTEGDEVRVLVAGDDGPHYGAEELREQDARAIAWLLAADEGRAESHASGIAFTLPTLAASRRRGG